MTKPDDPYDGVATNDRSDRSTYFWAVDGDGADPSSTVIEGVADVTGTDLTQLRPLYEVIDPEGLDSLFAANDRRSSGSTNGYVTFRFEGCDVTVRADGQTVVTPAADDWA